MAASQAPNMLRRSWWDGLELALVNTLLHQWAQEIDFLAMDGAVVTQIPLPPAIAERKRGGMTNGRNTV